MPILHYVPRVALGDLTFPLHIFCFYIPTHSIYYYSMHQNSGDPLKAKGKILDLPGLWTVCVMEGGAVEWKGRGVGTQPPGLIVYCNSGFQALLLTALLVGLAVSAGLPLGALPEMLLPLAFAATFTTFIFSLFLYLKALVAPASALAPGGNSGERGSRRVQTEVDGGARLNLQPPLFSRQSHLRLLPGTGAQPARLVL